MLIDNAIRLTDAVPDAWSAVLSCLRNSLSSAAVDMWFGNENLTLESISCAHARLVAANSLVESWIRGHFKDELLAAFRKVDPSVVDFEIVVSEKSQASPVPLISVNTPAPARLARRPRVSEEEKIRIAEDAATVASFYPEFSFDTFVEGDSNRIALAMCRTIAENPLECSMNPFFLFGGPGVGKTHLLQSIGRYAIMYRTSSSTVYRTSEQFLKIFIQMQTAPTREERQAASSALRHAFEDPQLLLVDDIQVLAGKGGGATEKALFDVLQKRVAAKRETVFCADRRPSEIKNLYEGFTRFDGNSIAVDTPDLLMRMNILRAKAAKLQIPAAERERIFHWVATHQRGNVREIEGVVTKLFAYHDLLGVNLTLESFQDLCGSCQIASPSPSADRPAPTIASIKEVVALAYKVPVESLCANSRVKSVSVPRKIAMYFCREMTKESLSNIGFHFGRDYSTVIANIKSVEREMRHDPEFAQKVDGLRQSFAV